MINYLNNVYILFICIFSAVQLCFWSNISTNIVGRLLYCYISCFLHIWASCPRSCQAGSGTRTQMQIGQRFKQALFWTVWGYKREQNKKHPNGGKGLRKITSTANRLTKRIINERSLLFRRGNRKSKNTNSSSGRGKDKAVWPETRGKLLFKIKPEIDKTKSRVARRCGLVRRK